MVDNFWRLADSSNTQQITATFSLSVRHQPETLCKVLEKPVSFWSGYPPDNFYLLEIYIPVI